MFLACSFGRSVIRLSARTYPSGLASDTGRDPGVVRAPAGATAGCTFSQQPRRALGRMAGGSLVRLGTGFAARKRVERTTAETRIVWVRAPFTAGCVFGRASRLGGAASTTRVSPADVLAGATCFAPAMLEPSFCVGGCCAVRACASPPEGGLWLGTDDEAFTDAPGTETSMLPPCTLTETLGVPTVT